MNEARYIYCVASGREKITFGRIGIERSKVYTIPYRDLCAVVHDCPPVPYQSEDQEEVKFWIIAHEKVVESAWKRFSLVLPLGFDTIVKGEKDLNAEENLRKWLAEDYDNLKHKLEKLKDKAEFGVQIFWDQKIIGKKIMEKNPEIKRLNEEIKSRSRGTAYMYKQRLESLLKKEMEKEGERYFQEFYGSIKKCIDDHKLDKTKKSEEGKQMLMNLSCLLSQDKNQALGDELEKIDKMEGFSVRFTGPWPPYSFV